MSAIASFRGREILDSRGTPTVEVECVLASGVRARAAVPSGASTGTREAVELRDGDRTRYGGRGVIRAARNVSGELSRHLSGREAQDQIGLDAAMIELDGTPTKSRLGANAVLGCSLAAARAAALEDGIPLYRRWGGSGATLLPVPFFNILNGGAHADNSVDLQEFMVAPVGAPSFAEGLRWGAEVYAALRAALRERGLATGIGDEGGFAPDLARNRDALELLMEAIGRAGRRPGTDIVIGLDPAASELHRSGSYRLEGEGRSLSPDELVDYWEELVGAYPVVLLEDGMAEDDWPGWRRLTKRLGDRVELVGDDVFVTNREILRRGVAEGIGNAVLIKLNQIGTVSETLETMALARAAGYACFVSHRSGETWDDVIADLTVATGAGHLKSGAPVRGEPVAKYNRLLDIERELGAAGRYAGSSILRRAAGPE